MEKIVTEENFNEILKSDKPVMVDFWATWCGPCRMLAPTIESLASKYDGKAIVGKCNVDEAREIPVQFGIMSIPTILFFKDGQLVDRLVGAVPEATIAAKLDSLI